MNNMSSKQQFLKNLYEAFNKREIETIISVMHPDVKWANGMEGGSFTDATTCVSIGKSSSRLFTGSLSL